jgi:hypothetical protein
MNTTDEAYRLPANYTIKYFGNYSHDSNSSELVYSIQDKHFNLLHRLVVIVEDDVQLYGIMNGFPCIPKDELHRYPQLESGKNKKAICITMEASSSLCDIVGTIAALRTNKRRDVAPFLAKAIKYRPSSSKVEQKHNQVTASRDKILTHDNGIAATKTKDPEQATLDPIGSKSKRRRSQKQPKNGDTSRKRTRDRKHQHADAKPKRKKSKKSSVPLVPLLVQSEKQDSDSDSYILPPHPVINQQQKKEKHDVIATSPLVTKTKKKRKTDIRQSLDEDKDGKYDESTQELSLHDDSSDAETDTEVVRQTKPDHTMHQYVNESKDNRAVNPTPTPVPLGGSGDKSMQDPLPVLPVPFDLTIPTTVQHAGQAALSKNHLNRDTATEKPSMKSPNPGTENTIVLSPMPNLIQHVMNPSVSTQKAMNAIQRDYGFKRNIETQARSSYLSNMKKSVGRSSINPNIIPRVVAADPLPVEGDSDSESDSDQEDNIQTVYKTSYKKNPSMYQDLRPVYYD